MMFSSRRSRNRHSANPNPKLHSPHMRRKISPHDGRTAGPALNLNSPTLMLPPQMRFPPFLGGLSVLGSPNGDSDDGNLKDEDGQSLSGDEDHHHVDFQEEAEEDGMMIKMVK
jgi:hypothetical protein